MSTAKERGALGKRFHDLPTPTDAPDLSWEAMAGNILPPSPEEEPENWYPFWWWIIGVFVLLVGGGLYLRSAEGTPTTQPKAVTVADIGASEASALNDAEVNSSPAATGEAIGGPTFTEPADGESGLAVSAGVGESTAGRTASTDSDGMEDTQITAEDTSQVDVLPFTAEPILANKPGSTALLPTLPLESVEVPVKYPKMIPEVSTPQSDSKETPGSSVLLAVGAFTANLGYASPEETQISPQLRLGYEQSFTDNWSVVAGIGVRHYRFRTAFESVEENARIYQPGTVDTIFRNLTTGDERIVTTDTVSGTRIRRFSNDNAITALGVPVLLRRHWSLGGHRLSLAAGPRIGLVLGRTGKTVVGDYQVINLTDAPQFGQNLRVSGRLEVGYDWNFTKTWSVALRVGAETALTDWSTNGAGQRPRRVDGMIGLRYRW